MTSSWLRRSLAFILFGMLFHMSTRQRLTFLSTYTYHTRPRLPQPDFRFFFLLLSTELCVNKRNKTKSIPLALRNIVSIPTTFTQTHGQGVLSYVTMLYLITEYLHRYTYNDCVNKCLSIFTISVLYSNILNWWIISIFFFYCFALVWWCFSNINETTFIKY